MKILRINQGHTKNYGDIAIDKAISECFKGSKGLFIPFWSEEEVYGLLWKIPLINKIIPRLRFVTDYLNTVRIRKAIKQDEIDVAIIGGGELISSHRGFNSSLYCFSKVLAKNKVPFYVVGVSGGEHLSKKQIDRDKIALKRAKMVIVRDSFTYDFFVKELGITPMISPDVVFSLGKKEKNNNPKARAMIMVCPIASRKKNMKGLDVSSEIEYIDYYIERAKKHYRNGDEIIVSPTTKPDEGISLKIAKKMREVGLRAKYVPYVSLEKFQEMLDNCRIVIAARMHAMILGINHGCDIEPVEFRQKLITFSNEYKNARRRETIFEGSLKSLSALKRKIENDTGKTVS